MRVRTIIAILIATFLVYLLFWPIDKAFPSFSVEPAPAFVGPLAPNTALDDVHTLGTVGEAPEDLAIDRAGTLYTGVADGHIFTLPRGAKTWEPITVTYGLPLGLGFSPDDKWLYISDAEKGLMRTDKAGHLERLIDTFAGADLGFVNDLVVAPWGTVYFTSSGTDYSFANLNDALIAHVGGGRLYAYDPRQKTLELLLDDLYFANGVALDTARRTVFVAETGLYRIQQFQLASGEVSVFAENLPGFPDGLNFDRHGQLWVTLVSRRSALLDALADRPFLRKMAYRLPSGLQPPPDRYGLLVAYDREGRLVESLHGPNGDFPGISNAVWQGDTLYLGSIYTRSIGRYIATD